MPALQTNIYDSAIYFSLQFNDLSTLILQPEFFVIEPNNWNKITNYIPRDSQWYGFWSDFIEDKYGLSFSFASKNGLTGGGEWLQNIYNTYGDQAEVYFTIGYANQSGVPYEQIKSWRVNLQEYELDMGSDILPFGGVLTSIEKMPFQGKLKARMSAPCTINGLLTMDGELLTPIPTYTLRLHSKTLEEETLMQTSTPQSPQQLDNVEVPTLGRYDWVIQPDQQNSVVNELYEVFTQPPGIISTDIDDGTTIGPKSPVEGGLGYTSPSTEYLDGICQYTPSTNGSLEIAWSGSSIIYTSGQCGNFPSLPSATLWGVNICPRAVQYRLVEGVWTLIDVVAGKISTLGTNLPPTNIPPTPDVIVTIGYDINGASQQYILPNIVQIGDVTIADQRGASFTDAIVTRYDGYTWDETFNLTVEAGDQIFVHIVALQWDSFNATSSGDNQNRGIQFDQLINEITYNQLTTTPGSTAPAYRAIDLLNQMVENITGQVNAVKSSYFSKGGAGWNILFTNGYGLRNFNTVINLPKKSLESFLTDLQATECLGVGIQEFPSTEGGTGSNAKTEYLLIEYITTLFQNKIIATYTQTLNVKEKHNTSLSYNKFQFGFNTWQGLNLVMEDEFCTQGNYLTQFLKYGDNMLSKLSSTIFSGYIIEEQRRNQFNLNPNQSITNDDDFFGICTWEPNTFNQLEVNFVINATTGQSIALFLNISSLSLIQGDKFSYAVQNWVSGFNYLELSVVNDPGYGFYYLILDKVNGIIPPHLDATNWASGKGLNNGTVFFVSSEVSGYPQIGEDAYFLDCPLTWVSGNDWVVGDLCWDGVKYWICRLGLTSTTTPASDGDHWFKLIGFNVWESGYTYTAGLPVSYKNYAYESLNTVTSSTPPPSDPTNWVLLSTPGSNTGTMLYNKVPVIETGVYVFTVIPSSPDQVFAERNQPFQICTGVIDPSTIYNARKSMKHILYNWMPIVAIGLYFINAESQDYVVSQIVTTLVKMNSKLTTKFFSSEQFPGNTAGITLNEFNREFISTCLTNVSWLFSPKQMTLSIRGGWNDSENIRMALCGETGNANIDFGGLALSDSNGDLWFCHVNSLKYNLVTEMIDLDVQKVVLLQKAISS